MYSLTLLAIAFPGDDENRSVLEDQLWEKEVADECHQSRIGYFTILRSIGNKSNGGVVSVESRVLHRTVFL